MKGVDRFGSPGIYVVVPEGLPVTGAVLADQVKSLDWTARECARICPLPADVVVQVLRRVTVLLDEKSPP